MSKLKGPKNPAAVARQEEELRVRMGQTSDSYRAATEGLRGFKQEYFNLQLPKLLRVSHFLSSTDLEERELTLIFVPSLPSVPRPCRA